MTLTQLRVFAVFALAYFVSFLFRGVNLGLAPFLTQEFGLSTNDLGTLTSLYFLGFAAAQIPAGVLLDRFGPRRVTALLMALAAAGALVFGMAHGLGALMAGRLLIGIGVSVCLGGAFKATAEHFRVAQLTLVNGLIMAVGGLGGVAVGAPLSWLLSLAGWRTVCVGLAVLTLAAAAAVAAFAPQTRPAGVPASVREQFRGTGLILRSAAFWKVAAFSTLTQGVFYAMQSLWAGAFLRDAALPGAGGTAAGALVSTMGLAFIAGNVGFGALARVLQRRGVGVATFSGGLMAAFVAVQVLIAARVALPDLALWAAYGALGGTGILTYAALAERFPAALLGRVNTAFTLLIFAAIFVLQLAIGAALGHWPMQAGHYPLAAHQAAWAGLVLLQVAGGVWYFLPGAVRRAPDLPIPGTVACVRDGTAASR